MRIINDELTEALVLLIENGADVFSRDASGLSASEIACCQETKWFETSILGRSNCDLTLKEIWTEALTTSGYNAEEVIAASRPIEELTESDNYSISDEHEEFDTAASHDSDENANETASDNEHRSIPDQRGEWEAVAAPNFEENANESACVGCEKQGSECESHQCSKWRINESFADQYEQQVLEGDAEVWRS